MKISINGTWQYFMCPNERFNLYKKSQPPLHLTQLRIWRLAAILQKKTFYKSYFAEKPPMKVPCSIYSKTLLKCIEHLLLLLVGSDSRTYRNDYDKSVFSAVTAVTVLASSQRWRNHVWSWLMTLEAYRPNRTPIRQWAERWKSSATFGRLARGSAWRSTSPP